MPKVVEQIFKVGRERERERRMGKGSQRVENCPTFLGFVCFFTICEVVVFSIHRVNNSQSGLQKWTESDTFFEFIKE